MGRSLSTPELNAGVSSIATATGFTAGDYVYQMRGGTGSVPDGALSTGAFAYNSIPSSILPMSTNSTADLVYPEINGGTSGGQVAAKLNNGNIVFVYARGAVGTYVQTAYFKIVDAAGATVVAETAVSGATVGGRYSVSVCVLPNNNFTVVWSNQNAGTNVNWNISFRIYQQDGTPVTAATTNTTLTLSSGTTNGGSLLKVTARSDNSFIIMAYNGYNVSFVAASAAGFSTAFNGGTGVYNRTVYNDARQYIDYAVRSDDTIHIFYVGTASPFTVLYDVLSSSGTATTSGGILGAFPNFYCVSCARMPNGNVNVFLYVQETATYNSIVAYSWNGTTLSYIGRPVQFSTATAPSYMLLASYPQGASNGFTLFYQNPDTSGALAYQSFNSSGVSVSGGIARLVPAISYPVGSMMQASIFDVGSDTRFYMNQRSNITLASSINMAGSYRGVYYFSYNATSYNLNRVSTATASFGNIGSVPLGAYNRANSTPVEAAFSVAATGDYTSQAPAGTNLVNKVVVSETSAYNISAIQLSNGNNVIAYIDTTNNLILKSYNTSGVETASALAVSGAAQQGGCPMAPFSNGTFIVCYRDYTVGTTLKYIIFNSSLVPVFSGNIATNIVNASTISFRPAVCAYGDGSQVAIAYSLNTNYLEVKNISSANVLSTVFTATTDPFSQPDSLYMLPYRGDAFSVVYRERGAASASIQAVTFWKTGATTWTRSNNFSIPNSLETNPLNVFVYPAPAPHSNTIGLTANGLDTTPRFFFAEPVWNANGSFEVANSPSIVGGFNLDGTIATHAIGMTGNGGLLWATQRLTNIGFFINYASLRPGFNSGSNSIGPVVNSGYRTSSSSVNTYGDLQIAPHVEGACLIAFLDNNNYPSFFVPMVYPSQVSKTLTAGTDISTTKLALNPDNGYVLRGVALTTATAGNTGLVQTKGVATVSNSYPSVATAFGFDSRNPITTTGVRGSVLGRTVTLEA